MGKLTVRKIAGIFETGMHNDGDGLYLNVSKTGSKSWILRTVVHGKRKELGLGSVKLVGLAEARDLATKYRKIAREGGDPDLVRKRKTMSFKDAAQRVHAQLLPTWRSQRQGEIWWSSLERLVFPHIGDRPIHTLNSADVLTVLTPIWSEKHDTARRVMNRLSAIFDWAKGSGHYHAENPVNGVRKALPTVGVKVQHMSAMPWRDMPDFMQALAQRKGISAKALEFLIHTAGRSGEIRGARWAEIDGDIWTIPAERMKTHSEHRVPLTEAARAALASVEGLDDALIFPSAHSASDGAAKPQSDVVFKALMKRMGFTDFTTHGFRSTFRDWCSEYAQADREVAEAALSHTLGNKVERAYARSDLFERRRLLMEKWSGFLTGEAAQVIPIRRAQS